MSTVTMEIKVFQEKPIVYNHLESTSGFYQSCGVARQVSHGEMLLRKLNSDMAEKHMVSYNRLKKQPF